jgi:transposase-like protein
MDGLPATLIEAIQYYSDPAICRNQLAAMRWPDGVTCPRCGCQRVTFMVSVDRWNCKGCRKQFSVKVGTIFEDSPIGLHKWFAALWLIANAKNGISSCEVSRALGITQKSAWFVLHRIRLAMQSGTIEKQEGTFEVDETFVGGLEKNKHKSKKQNAGRGSVGKTIVFGVLQRGNGTKDATGRRLRSEERIYSQVQATVIRDTSHITLQTEIAARVKAGSEVFSDSHRGYNGLADSYIHAFVDHAVEYAEGRITTNGIENFWSLFDRIVHGTYIKPEPQHLFRYVDEQTFRFNQRGGTDLTRFLQTLHQVSGKRLTFDELTTGHLQYIVPK